MFARPNSQHSQVAYVTNDIDAAIARPVSRRHRDHFDRPARAALDQRTIGVE